MFKKTLSVVCFLFFGLLQIQGQLLNVAIDKATKQSSTLNNGLSNLAVDNITDGNYNNGSVTQTNNEANAWWQIDLESNIDISLIKIYNRTDAFSERLANFYVFISKTYLIAPVYIVNGNPIKGLFKMFIPLKKFIKTNNDNYLKKVINVLFSEADDFAVKFMGTTFQNCNMDFSPLPIISKQSAKNIKTPITIIAAEKDIMFPGKKMIKRAKKVFPSLQEVVLLKEAKHVPYKQDFKSIEEIILNDKT